MIAHADDLRQVTGDEQLAEQVKVDFEQAEALDDKTKALLRFLCQANHEGTSVSEADVQALRDAGWTDKAILEGVVVTGLFQYFNIVADALHIDLEPDMPPMPDGWTGRTPRPPDADA